jgi:hypothetical protein
MAAILNPCPHPPPPHTRRQVMIGERLFPLIAKLQPKFWAGKITGMLLYICDNDKLLMLLESTDALSSMVYEAKWVRVRRSRGLRPTK